MSRKNSRDLFLLIKSLNKSEKGYITKMSFQHQEKNSNFLRLFTAIDNQEVYNEAELLKKEKYIKQLPRLKIYLYERILASLDSYYSKKNINISLQKMLSRVYVLLPKGLYDQAIKQLYKARELALRHEKFTILLEIYDLQRMLLVEKQQISSARKVQEEEEHTIQQIHNLSFYKSRYEEISKLYVEIIYTRSEEEENALKKIISHPNFSGIREAKSLQAKIIFYKTLCKYYAALDDEKRYLQHARAAIALAEKNPHYITENILQYIKLLNNFLASASENALHAEFEASLKKLQQIPALYDSAQKNIVRSIIHLRVTIREYFHARNMLDYNRALEWANVLEKQLTEHHALISSTHEVIFFYQVAYIHFIHANFRKAIFWANKVINSPLSADKLFFHSFARILTLACYFELGDIAALRSMLSSTERLLAKHNKMYSLESILIRFFKNYLSQKDKINTVELLPVLEKDLQKNFNPMEDKILEYFDVFAWHKSKATGQTLLHVIRQGNHLPPSA
ncbi:MAG: hypothetical protein JWO44_1736 [Bacteroidetes bacterium]|nr:hypothetical protein [Bacteroidota bacterium]